MSQKFKSELELQALNNATTDTDKFLVSDGGVIKYRTGAEILSDLGVSPGIASKIQHQVKAGVAINKGQAVYVTGADGTNMIVGLASNSSEATSSKTMGLLNATVATNGFADVIAEGLLAGLNTSTATAGDPVWLGTNGNLIYGLLNKPHAPAHLVFIGIVTRVNANNGEIFVKVQNGFELHELHDVDLKTTAPINGHILGFDGTLWVNKTIAGWLGYTPANASGTTNYVSKFTGSTTLGNSQIFDNGTNVGIGTATPDSYPYGGKLNVNGDISTNTVGKIGWGVTDSFTLNGINTAHYGMSSNSNFLNISGYGGVVVATNGSERMRITSAGNVGIGTTTPSSRLHVYSSSEVSRIESSNTTLYQTFKANGTNVGYIGNGTGVVGGGSATDFGIQAPNNFVFATGGSSERMRITSAGDVGIGTSTPSAKLQVNGNATPGNYAAYINNVSGGGNVLKLYNHDWDVTDYLLYATNGGGYSFVIDGNGKVGIGTTSPSYKLDVIGSSRFSTTSADSYPLTLQNGLLKANNNYLGFQLKSSDVDYLSGILLLNGGTNKVLQLYAYEEGYGFRNLALGGGGNVGIGTSSPSQKLEVSGIGYASSDFRAPIFYDANNTDYYVDLASTSDAAIRVRGGAIHGPNPTWGKYLLVGGDGRQNYTNNADVASVCTTDGNLHIDAGSTKSLYLNYYDGDYILLGNGASSIVSSINNDGSHRPQIVYDYNNTGYYLDPNNTSNLNIVRAANRLTGAWIGVDNTSSSTGNGISLYNGASSGQPTYGIMFAGTGTFGVHGTVGANDWATYFTMSDDITRGWIFRRGSTNVASISGGGVLQTSGYIYSSTYVQSGNSMYSPIYYDANNTGFYLDGGNSSSGGWRLATPSGVIDFGPLNSYHAHIYTDRPNFYFNAALLINGANVLYENVWLNNKYFASGGEIYCTSIYDSDNGAYYLNPAGGSNLNTVSAINYTFTGASSGTPGLVTSTSAFKALSSDGTTYGYGVSTNIAGGLDIMANQSGQPIRFWAGTTNISPVQRMIISNGDVTASDSFRAPIFYDSNNTGYYVDAASLTNLWDLQITGASNKYLTINPGNGYEAMVRYNGGSGSSWYVGKRAANQTVTTADFHFYSEAAGISVAGIDVGGNIFSTQSVRTGVFYDLDDTSYYVNPAASSRFNNGNFTGNCSWFGGYGGGSGPGLGFENQSTFARMAFWGLDFWDWNSGSAMTINNGYVLASGDFRAPIFYDSNNTAYYFDGSNTSDSIRCAGDIVAYYSDERLKDKKGNIENALEKVLSLNGFYYEPNEVAQELGYKKRLEVGVSAQEVEVVLPELIKDAPIGQGYKTLDYGKLTPLLIEAVKEQQKQIEELKELVNKLINK